MKKLIISIGISGSGKSRYFSDKNPIVCPDELRKEIAGSVNIHDKDFQVWLEAYKRVRSYFNTYDTVYFDATFCKTRYRNRTLKELQKIIPDIIFEAVIFPADIKLSHERITKDLTIGKDRSNVSYQVLLEQLEAFNNTLRIISKNEDLFFRKELNNYSFYPKD